MIEVSNENSQIIQLNEMMLNVKGHLEDDVERSIYYPKLRNLLHSEIFHFCKEQLELKADLNFFRMSVGQVMSEVEIRDYLDGLKLKYNNKDDSNVALEYHIEETRIDIGVPVMVVIKRGNNINMKKFVFRFKKGNIGKDLSDTLSHAQIPLDVLKEGR